MSVVGIVDKSDICRRLSLAETARFEYRSKASDKNQRNFHSAIAYLHSDVAKYRSQTGACCKVVCGVVNISVEVRYSQCETEVLYSYRWV